MRRSRTEPGASGRTDATTRRQLLRTAAAGAGTFGIAGAAAPATAQESGDLLREPFLGPGVEDVDVTVAELDDGQPADAAPWDVTFGDGEVVVEAYWRLTSMGCIEVQPIGVGYAADREELGVELAEFHRPDAICMPAETTARVTVTVHLADDVEPGSVRIGTRTGSIDALRPTVHVAHRDGDRPPAPAGVEAYEFSTRQPLSPGPRLDHPRIHVDGTEVTVTGTVELPEECAECSLERLDLVDTETGTLLEVGVHETPAVGTPVAHTCGDPTLYVYDLTVTFEGDPPAGISVLESDAAGARVRSSGSAGSAVVGSDWVDEYEFRASTAPDADPTVEPTVVFGDEAVDDPAVSVEGTAPTCGLTTTLPDVAGLAGEASADATAEIAASIRDRQLSTPPRYPEGHESACATAVAASYELTVRTADGTVPARAEVREAGAGTDETTIVERADLPTPATPTGLEVVGVTPTAVTLEWEPTGAAGYQVVVDGERTHIGDRLNPPEYRYRGVTEEPRARVRLVPDAEHEVGVRALDEAGHPSPVTTTTVTTPSERTPSADDVEIVPVPDRVEEGSAVAIRVPEIPADAGVESFRLVASRDANEPHVTGTLTPLWHEAEAPAGDGFDLVYRDVFGATEVTVEGVAAADVVTGGREGVELCVITHDGDPEQTHVDVDLESLVFAGDGTERGPPPLGEHRPEPHGDDGLYRDVTGDGDLGTDDVSLFQEHLFSDAVQENAEFYNFSESPDGSVSHADVIALFQAATGL